MNTNAVLSDAERLNLCEIPNGMLPVVIDTDAFNEIDDQFAILYSLFSPDRIDLQAIYAAHFYNDRASSSADGMEKSYQEILKLLSMADGKFTGRVFRGCKNPLTGPQCAEEAPAVLDLIKKARSHSPQTPLYVLSIATCTNVASALLLAPDIVDKIVVVSLLGNSPGWHTQNEFNLENDIIAAQVLFDSGVPLVLVPGGGVTEFLLTSVPELNYHLGAKNQLCDYLVEAVRQYSAERNTLSKPIWDIGPVGYLICQDWAVVKTIPAPLVHGDGGISYPPTRHLIRCVCVLNRDAIFMDMYSKLTQMS